MPRKLFISFLGTSFYENCVYYDQKHSYSPTKYIQLATLEQIGASQWASTDTIRIFTTQRAFKLNWDASDSQRFNSKTNQAEPYLRLGQLIADRQFAADVRYVVIPDGNNEAEIWEIFDTVFREIQPNDELYIDLTHAFRFQPMLMLVLSNYAKFLKNITVKHLSYGNWEARTKNTENNDTTPPRAPIIDLLPLTQLQDWTTAAAEFLNDGRADRIRALSLDLTKPLNNSNASIQAFTDALVEFTTERQYCRGDLISTGKAVSDIADAADNLQQFPSNIAPLFPLLNYIRENTTHHSTPLERILDAVDWCCSMMLYQQAATLLQEGIVSFFCERYNLGLNANERGLVNSAFEIDANTIRREDWIVKKPDFIPILETLVADKDIQSLASMFQSLKELRNTFNHAGFRPKEENKTVDADIIPIWCDLFRTALCTQTQRVVPLRAHQRVFLNLSNHPFADWQQSQKISASAYGEIVDFSFPIVKPQISEKKLRQLARQTVDKILTEYQDCDLTVHVMGEMTLTYHIVSLLKAAGVRCVASCTDREAEDLENGRKLSQFTFVRFREY